MSAEPVQRVVVGVNGSLGNLSALHVALALARRWEASLVAVHAWAPVGGEVAYRRAPWKPLLDLYRERAQLALDGAFSDAFGGQPKDVNVLSVLVRGEAGPSLVAIAERPTDVIVVGTGHRPWLLRTWVGPVSRYCVSHARCPVLTVPAPAMLRDIPRSQRRAIGSRDLSLNAATPSSRS